MPIYEYACPDCGHKFDEIQKFTDEPITLCPKCAQKNVKKLISQTSFILKGGGWYKDHYGLKPGGAEGKGEGSKSEGSASEGKSEGTKSDGKSESSSTPAAPAASPASSSGSSTPAAGSGSTPSST